MHQRWRTLSTLGLILLLSASMAQAVPYATGKMRWTWAKGASPADLDALEFRVSCGLVSGQYTFPVKSYPVIERTALIKDVIPPTFVQIQRTFFCVIAAWNGAEKSPSSAEIVVTIDSQLAAPAFVGFE